MPKSEKRVDQKPIEAKPSEVQESEPQPEFSSSRQLKAYLSRSFAGPLPPPEVFVGYEKTLKGAANRILKMAERQAEHRQLLEREDLKSESTAIARGQWFAFFVTVLVILAGTYLIGIGLSPWGLALILTDLALLAGIFLFNKYQEHRENGRNIE